MFLWDNKNWEFTNSSASVAVPYITNIAAGDFDYDGKLDLLVSGLIVNTTTVGSANGTTNGTTNSTTNNNVYPDARLHKCIIQFDSELDM